MGLEGKLVLNAKLNNVQKGWNIVLPLENPYPRSEKYSVKLSNSYFFDEQDKLFKNLAEKMRHNIHLSSVIVSLPWDYFIRKVNAYFNVEIFLYFGSFFRSVNADAFIVAERETDYRDPH